MRRFDVHAFDLGGVYRPERGVFVQLTWEITNDLIVTLGDQAVADFVSDTVIGGVSPCSSGQSRFVNGSRWPASSWKRHVFSRTISGISSVSAVLIRVVVIGTFLGVSRPGQYKVVIFN